MKILRALLAAVITLLVPIAAICLPSYTGFTSRPTGYVVTASDWNGEFQNFINHVNTYCIGTLNLMNSKGYLLTGDGSNIGAVTNAGSSDNGKVLQLDSTQTRGVKWAAVANTTALTTKGDILTYSTNLDRLGVGSNGQVLTADSTQATGIKWADGGLPTGSIILWSGSIATIPSGYRLCDGTSGTPNLQGLFIVGAGNVSPAATGGMGLISPGGPSGDSSAGTGLGPAHNHTVNAFGVTGGASLAGNYGATSSATITPRYYALAYIQKI